MWNYFFRRGVSTETFQKIFNDNSSILYFFAQYREHIMILLVLQLKFRRHLAAVSHQCNAQVGCGMTVDYGAIILVY